MRGHMPKPILLLLSCLILAGGTLAQDARMSRTQLEVVEAERAFAKYSVENGQPEAWLEFFSDDGLIFKGGPVNAKEFNRKLVPTARPFVGVLNWEPRYGDIAQAGDMGYNFGPWIYLSNVEPKGISGAGYFITIWKKQADGKWKESFDFGTPMSKPSADHKLGQPFVPARQYKIQVPKGGSPAEELLRLTDAEKAFAANAAANGVLDTYLEQIAEEAKVLRIAMLPGDKTALRSFIPAGKEGALVFAPIGGDVARSRDLGYTYGKYELTQSDSKKETGYYTHVWKRSETGKWLVVMAGFRPDQYTRQK